MWNVKWRRCAGKGRGTRRREASGNRRLPGILSGAPEKKLERPEGIGAPSGLLYNLSGIREAIDIIPQKIRKSKSCIYFFILIKYFSYFAAAAVVKLQGVGASTPPSAARNPVNPSAFR